MIPGHANLKDEFGKSLLLSRGSLRKSKWAREKVDMQDSYTIYFVSKHLLEEFRLAAKEGVGGRILIFSRAWRRFGSLAYLLQLINHKWAACAVRLCQQPGNTSGKADNQETILDLL